MPWHGMASVNQTRPHSVNQMGKTHSKPLAARHGRGMITAWERHAMCESAFNVQFKASASAVSEPPPLQKKKLWMAKSKRSVGHFGIRSLLLFPSFNEVHAIENNFNICMLR